MFTDFDHYRTDDVFLVVNTEGGEKGDLRFNVAVFETLADAETYCNNRAWLHIESVPYFQNTKRNI